MLDLRRRFLRALSISLRIFNANSGEWGKSYVMDTSFHQQYNEFLSHSSIAMKEEPKNESCHYRGVESRAGAFSFRFFLGTVSDGFRL